MGPFRPHRHKGVVFVKVMEATEPTPSAQLDWPKLISGTLRRRYKRFLAEVELDTGRIITAHCPNTGSMKGCAEAGRTVYLSYHDDPRRKLKYTWQLIQMAESLVGVNTLVPNRLVEMALRAGEIPELGFPVDIRREVSVGKGSRIDLMLADASGPNGYVEIKNCTLVEEGIARFPDAVTTRGVKHLMELDRLRQSGSRCFMFFLIQRMDARLFQPADHIDPEYGVVLRRVAKNGVEVLAYDVDVNLSRIRLRRPIPCNI
jgi:sugar fermentation stimulation protein A